MDQLKKNIQKKFKLRFSDELEKMFREDYFERTLPIARIALIMAFILYAVFGVLDLFISPATKNFTWLIRYAIVCPVIAFVFILSFLKGFKLFMQLSAGIVSLTAGIGIIAMIATAQSIDVGLYYYAGLTLVIMWSYTFVRLTFINATAVCWIIVIVYELSILFFPQRIPHSQLLNAVISNNFFFISSNIIGMFACFHMERYTRLDFLQRQAILKNNKKIEEEKNELREWRRIMDIELDMARSIQQKLIPDNNPADFISALFRPMEPIGGDFYDFIKFREPDIIGIFISDVSGHGVPAALITTMIKSLISDAGERKNNPAELMAHLNEILIEQTGNDHVTAFYGIYSRKERTFTYSSAGHNPPYLIHNSSIIELNKSKCMPLGILTNEGLNKRNMRFTNHTEILPPNSKLLLYTDGLTEAKHQNDKSKFFEDTAKELLISFKNMSCKKTVEALYSQLVDFSGSENFQDDVCIICIDID